MKIMLIVDKNPFYVNSAAANRLRSLVEGLLKYQVDIQMIITRGYTSLLEFKKLRFNGEFSEIKYLYLTFIIQNNIWLKRMDRYIINPLLSRITRLLVLRTIKKSDADIVWSSLSYENLKLFPQIKSYGKKIFVEISEFMDIHKNNDGNFLIKKKGDLRKDYFENIAIKQIDIMALMTVTLHNYYTGLSSFNAAALHLPMTVDLKRFNVNKEYDIYSELTKPYIAFVGVMNNKKEGINVLIKAFAQLSKLYPDLRLYLYGFYHHDTPSHLRIIKELNLQNRVFYKGLVSRDDIPKIIMNAELLVMARPDSKQAQGGFPTKLGEYLATGRPVCATAVGEIPDYLVDGESVYFAEPGSVESFADAMKRALENPIEAKGIGINGRRVAEKYFNKDIQAKMLYNFLKENNAR